MLVCSQYPVPRCRTFGTVFSMMVIVVDSTNYRFLRGDNREWIYPAAVSSVRSGSVQLHCPNRKHQNTCNLLTFSCPELLFHRGLCRIGPLPRLGTSAGVLFSGIYSGRRSPSTSSAGIIRFRFKGYDLRFITTPVLYKIYDVSECLSIGFGILFNSWNYVKIR
jgi:hypothetical protein